MTTHPSRAACLGGKYFFDDDQQFPDTQYAVFEYHAMAVPQGRTTQLIFEQRIWSPYVQEGYESGAAFYGTDGHANHRTHERLEAVRRAKQTGGRVRQAGRRSTNITIIFSLAFVGRQSNRRPTQ